MAEIKVSEALDFLSNWKTRKELEDKFCISNSSSFRLLRWLKKGRYIEEKKLFIKGHNNKQWFYKVIINVGTSNDLHSDERRNKSQDNSVP